MYATINEVKGKIVGVEQILFLLNQQLGDWEYYDVVERCRESLADAMELIDKK